jgi:hypothetical protein
MLRDLISAEKPDIVLLQETKCTSKDIDRLLPYYWKQGEETSTAAIGRWRIGYPLEHQLSAIGKFSHHQVVHYYRL